MPHSLPPLPVPAWNTQATYSSIYTPGIHAIDPHSSIATSIHKLVEKVGFGPFGFAPVMPTGLTGGAFPGLFRVGTDEMRPLNALRGISRLFTKRPEAIAPTGGPWLHNWAPQSPLGALLLPLVWVLGYIQSAFRNPSHLLLLVLWYAVYTTSTGGTGALVQALTVCFLYILFQNINVVTPPFLRDGALSTTKAYTDVHDEWAKEVQRASAGEDRPWVKSRTSRRDQSREGASIHGKWVSDTYSGIHPAQFPEDTDPSTSADEKMREKSLLQIAEGSAAAAAAAAVSAVPRPPPRAPAPRSSGGYARVPGWLAALSLLQVASASDAPTTPATPATPTTPAAPTPATPRAPAPGSDYPIKVRNEATKWHSFKMSDPATLGKELQETTAKLRERAGAPSGKPPDNLPPTLAYYRALQFPMTTPLLLGLSNPLANPYTNPLVRIATPVVSDPANPARLFHPSLQGLRSPRITQFAQAVPPLPYPFYNEP